MAKKKDVSKKASKKPAAKAEPAGGKSLQVPKDQVGAAVQAMISFEGATQVAAVEVDDATFTVTRLA